MSNRQKKKLSALVIVNPTVRIKLMIHRVNMCEGISKKFAKKIIIVKDGAELSRSLLDKSDFPINNQYLLDILNS